MEIDQNLNIYREKDRKDIQTQMQTEPERNNNNNNELVFKFVLTYYSCHRSTKNL